MRPRTGIAAFVTVVGVAGALAAAAGPGAQASTAGHPADHGARLIPGDLLVSTTAGLQKWVYNQTAGEWQLAYTLQNGLNLGTPYTVRGYPTGTNSVADKLGAAALPSSERFFTVVAPRDDQVVRGVSFTPGTHR